MQTLNLFDKEISQFKAFRLYGEKFQDDLNHGKQLLEKLQCTLDIEELLNIFAIEAARFVDFSGLYFQGAGLKIAVSKSKPARNERKYELKINDQFIGTITYAINSPISLTNHQILKELHFYLSHPLNNAVMYHQAMLLAMQDGLTGLGNRRYFDEQLKRSMHQANRHQTHVGLIVADLDKFKPINDTHGHKVGDKILISFGKILLKSVRDTDSVFRFGGDEFAIIVEQADAQALELIEYRIKSELKQDSVLMQYKVGFSLGKTFMNRADDEHSFFERADDALYQDKNRTPVNLKLIRK